MDRVTKVPTKGFKVSTKGCQVPTKSFQQTSFHRTKFVREDFKPGTLQVEIDSGNLVRTSFAKGRHSDGTVFKGEAYLPEQAIIEVRQQSEAYERGRKNAHDARQAKLEIAHKLNEDKLGIAHKQTEDTLEMLHNEKRERALVITNITDAALAGAVSAFTLSTVENASAYYRREKGGGEAALQVIKDTGA